MSFFYSFPIFFYNIFRLFLHILLPETNKRGHSGPTGARTPKMFSNEDEIQTTMDDANIKSCISRESMRQLYEMRTNNILCDAVIKLQDNTSFNVHRNILGSCSPFFR